MHLTVPNGITLSRLLFAAAFGYLLFTGHGRGSLVAAFALAAASDGLDGFAARRLGQTSPGGAVLDQMVDRAFTAVVAGVLIAYSVMHPRLPVGGWTPQSDLLLLVALACTRELVALPAVAIVLARRKRLYHVEWIGKVATFVQSVTLGVIVLGVPWALPVAIVCAAVGVVSAANYLRYSLR